MRYLFYAFLLFAQVACGQTNSRDTTQTRKIETNVSEKVYSENQYVKFGQKYVEVGSYKKAIEMYNKAIQKNPDYLGAYLERASCYKEMAYFTKAIADLDLVLKKDTDNPLAYNNLGNVFFFERGSYNCYKLL